MQTHQSNTERTSRKTRKETERDEAIEWLRERLQKGMTIYTVLRHVSASGMSRQIDLYYVTDNCPLRITWSAARALGWTYNKKWESLHVDGCGMDCGHAAVYHLSRVLFGDGYALKQTWL
ncbi:hypothetical protein Ga0100231_019025 [Opitutaceae bacterium TAV4]|nr:hypothetical protein Ga0100231_019025 [Opitutaceae bacterium TAV4]RRK00188.1 hypothetical protein Ga0100230_019690 [Opitutaceae bacterium TAV3]RRK02000.1 hypothetical protein Ga0100230_001940 [Opitutaceae bacterium TAV3]